MIETLLLDLRYGVRLLHRSAGFTLVAVVTLALGIGANTAIFSVVNGVLLQPLPYEDPGRLVQISEGNPRLGSGIHPVSPATYLDWHEHNPVFEALAAYHLTSVTLTGETRPVRIMAGVISPDFVDVLGVEPVIGRSFSPEESTPDNNSFVLLSHGLWQTRFSGRTEVSGETLVIDGQPHTVVGVMPAGFHFPRSGIDCWIPLAIDPANPGSRGHHYLRVVGRLPGNVGAAQAESAMDTLSAQLALETPALAGWDTVVRPFDEVVLGEAAPAIWILWGAVGFVMLIVCGNVANLMLTRSVVRQKEIAIRTSLGAGRGRIIRLLLTESVILALVGGALGILVALWALPSLVALSDGAIPRAESIGIDRFVLGFTAGLSVLTGILFGLLPALQMTRSDLTTSLKSGGRTQAAGGSARLRGLFVVTELALAVILLAGAGLMLRSFSTLHHVEPGFAPEGLLTFRLQLPVTRYPEQHQVSAFYDKLEERLAGLPDVDSAGRVQVLPTMGTHYNIFSIAGRPADPDARTSALYRAVSPSYFETMKIPILRGRGLSSRDTFDSPPVVLINEAFVRTHFPDTEPLGESLEMGVPVEIVGIVGDVRHLGLDTEPRPAMYVSTAQDPSNRSLAVVVRTSTDPAGLMPAVRSLTGTLDSDLPVFSVMTGEEIMGSSVADRRFAMTLLAIFAGLALTLAIVGIYGVVSYSTSLRSHEIGVRIALGAQYGDVIRVILGQGVKLALLGLGIGLAGALALTRYLEGMLYGVTPTDPITLTGTILFLFTSALVASFLPARRATGISPVSALRCD